MSVTLYYVHDPMCSWCWGYRPTWELLKQHLPSNIQVRNLLGGLAPDSSNPMSEEMKLQIQGHWQKIQQQLGTEFNFDFWDVNQPRRSTYIACRAVIAARNQGHEEAMINAIQRGYYLQAMNPSDLADLMQFAWTLHTQELEIDIDEFVTDIEAVETHRVLAQEMAQVQKLPVSGFPSLVLEIDGECQAIVRDYKDYRVALEKIEQAVNRARD